MMTAALVSLRNAMAEGCPWHTPRLVSPRRSPRLRTHWIAQRIENCSVTVSRLRLKRNKHHRLRQINVEMKTNSYNIYTKDHFAADSMPEQPPRSLVSEHSSKPTVSAKC